ncbi:MAG: FG-GAP repeat domain-containing protein [Planctomycetota bacterium]
MTRPNGLHIACGALLSAAIAAQDFVPAPFLSTNQSFAGASYYRHDFNGNGIDDLIIEVSFGFNEGIYLMLDPDLTSPNANVSSGFLASQLSLFGGQPQIMGFADMNADGLDDIVMEFESFGAPIGVYYIPGDGMGGFGSAVLLASSGNFTSTALGDFDGNGEQDFAIVVTGLAPSVTQVYLQNSGTFSLAWSKTAFPNALATGDFDGDGDDELALNFQGTLEVLIGGTTLGPVATFPVDPELDLGYGQDLDNDGFEDLVLQSASSPPWIVRVFSGNPTTTLEAPIDVIPGGGPNGSDFLGPFDVDGDGTDELLAAVRNTPGYTLIRHDGARGFSPQPYQTTLTGGLIDLDGDGDLDQIVPNTAFGGYDRFENLAIYGESCSGAAGDPLLDIGSAIPGNAAFDVSMTQVQPNTLALLFVSLAGQPAPCGPQIDFNQLLGAGLTATTNAAGTAMWALPLPAGLPEGPYYLQAAALDPAGVIINGTPLSATHGRTMRVY